MRLGKLPDLRATVTVRADGSLRVGVGLWDGLNFRPGHRVRADWDPAAQCLVLTRGTDEDRLYTASLALGRELLDLNVAVGNYRAERIGGALHCDLSGR